MVENQIKNYFDFLFYIGVTSDETSSKIIQLLSSSKYKNISNQEKDINNLLASLTCDYFKSLDKKQLELIGKNIYQQYLRNKLISELKVIKKLLIIRYNFFKRKKKKYFNKWRLSTINSDMNNYLFLNKNNSVKSIKTRTNSKKSIISSQHFLDKLDFYSDRKKENTDKLKLMSESSLTNECTFKPILKYPYKRNNSKKNVKINDKKNKKYYNKNEIDYFKQLFNDLINNNKPSERQNTNRNYNSPKNNKDNNINNKNNINLNNKYFSKMKVKTSEKKYKKVFKV